MYITWQYAYCAIASNLAKPVTITILLFRYNLDSNIISVDCYNGLVDRYNGFVGRYNRIVDRYNGKLDRHHEILDRYSGIVDRYNG